jgi:hypothetical protein
LWVNRATGRRRLEIISISSCAPTLNIYKP